MSGTNPLVANGWAVIFVSQRLDMGCPARIPPPRPGPGRSPWPIVLGLEALGAGADRAHVTVERRRASLQDVPWPRRPFRGRPAVPGHDPGVALGRLAADGHSVLNALMVPSASAARGAGGCGSADLRSCWLARVWWPPSRRRRDEVSPALTWSISNSRWVAPVRAHRTRRSRRTRRQSSSPLADDAEITSGVGNARQDVESRSSRSDPQVARFPCRDSTGSAPSIQVKSKYASPRPTQVRPGGPRRPVLASGPRRRRLWHGADSAKRSASLEADPARPRPWSYSLKPRPGCAAALPPQCRACVRACMKRMPEAIANPAPERASR